MTWLQTELVSFWCFFLCLSSAEILQANDSLTQVINLYRQLVKGEEVNGDTSSTARLPGTALMPSLSSVKSRDIEKIYSVVFGSGNFLCNRVSTNFDDSSDCILLVFIGRSTALLDLTGLDTSPSAQSFSEFPETPSSQELGISLLDDELMSLGKKSVMTLCHVILLILYELWIGAYEGLHKTLECMTQKY